jgi:hypothetical protein
VRFAVCRAQELDRVVPADSIDAVFSVAALHWVPAPTMPGCSGRSAGVLRAGGLFRAQFGGQGQIAAVKAILDEESARLGGGPAGWFFPAPADYRAAAGGGRVRRPGRRLGAAAATGPAVRDGRQMLGWLRSQTFPAYEPAASGGGRRGVPPPGRGAGGGRAATRRRFVRSGLHPAGLARYGPPEDEIACTVMVSRRA